MPKRYTSTEIWEEDWFLDMPVEYKLFWFYILGICDHAGLFRVNVRSFMGLNSVSITPEKALSYFNSGKQRVRIVNNSVWLIEDFFVFQYGSQFNENNKVHASVLELYLKVGVEVSSLRGLVGLKARDIYKDIYKDKESKEGVKGENWNPMPGESEMGIELPEIKAGAATLLYHAATKVMLLPDQITNFWEIFKKQNFTGDRSYPKVQDTYSHFINWIKNQKVNGSHFKSDTNTKLGTSAARIKAAKEF